MINYVRPLEIFYRDYFQDNIINLDFAISILEDTNIDADRIVSVFQLTVLKYHIAKPLIFLLGSSNDLESSVGFFPRDILKIVTIKLVKLYTQSNYEKLHSSFPIFKNIIEVKCLEKQEKFETNVQGKERLAIEIKDKKESAQKDINYIYLVWHGGV